MYKLYVRLAPGAYADGEAWNFWIIDPAGDKVWELNAVTCHQRAFDRAAQAAQTYMDLNVRNVPVDTLEQAAARALDLSEYTERCAKIFSVNYD